MLQKIWDRKKVSSRAEEGSKQKVKKTTKGDILQKLFGRCSSVPLLVWEWA